MQMTARLTGDATISTLKNDRQVVNFSVAINDSCESKGSAESDASLDRFSGWYFSPNYKFI